MQIDYDVGDVVVCVDDTFRGGGALNKEHLSLIRKGSFYKVIGLGYDGVAIDGVPYPYADGLVGGYYEDRFRKIPKASDEFTEQMRKMKPRKNKVDA